MGHTMGNLNGFSEILYLLTFLPGKTLYHIWFAIHVACWY